MRLLYLGVVWGLFLLIPLSFVLPGVEYVFRPESSLTPEGFVKSNLYGGIALFLTVILWGVYVKTQMQKPNLKEFYKRLLFDLPDFTGLNAKTTMKQLLFGAISGFILALTAFLLRYGQTIQFKPENTIILLITNPWMPIQSILIIPIIEEILYRGILIGLAFHLLKDKKTIWATAIAQALIFTYIHPQDTIYKLIPSLGFTILYTLNPKKNLKTCIIMHITANTLAMITMGN
jgi:membrane protease YdiL (CAAX protease family)